MVARRLIAVLVVLLVVSSFAAALLPDPATDEPGTTQSTTRESRGTTAHRPGGRLVHVTLDADAPRPRPVSLRVGDQLALRVRSSRPDQVEVRGFGQLATVDRFTPANFDLLAFDLGTFPVRLVEAGRTIGTIIVRSRRASSVRPETARSRGSDRA